jgi:hypothetical protein
MEGPLSPFMFPAWYRFQITSVLSILLLFGATVGTAKAQKAGSLAATSALHSTLSPVLGSLFMAHLRSSVWPKAGWMSGSWRGYAPSTPLTRESGPWTVTMSMGDESLDHAVTVLPELLLPISLSIVANRRLEQIQADNAFCQP